MTKIQISLRLDDDLLAKARAIAKLEGRTANNMIAYIVSQFVADYESEHGPVECQE